MHDTLSRNPGYEHKVCLFVNHCCITLKYMLNFLKSYKFGNEPEYFVREDISQYPAQPTLKHIGP